MFFCQATDARVGALEYFGEKKIYNLIFFYIILTTNFVFIFDSSCYRVDLFKNFLKKFKTVSYLLQLFHHAYLLS